MAKPELTVVPNAAIDLKEARDAMLHLRRNEDHGRVHICATLNFPNRAKVAKGYPTTPARARTMKMTDRTVGGVDDLPNVAPEATGAPSGPLETDPGALDLDLAPSEALRERLSADKETDAGLATVLGETGGDRSEVLISIAHRLKRLGYSAQEFVSIVMTVSAGARQHVLEQPMKARALARAWDRTNATPKPGAGTVVPEHVDASEISWAPSNVPAQSLPRRPWVVETLLLRGFLAALIGAPGVSKTMFLMALGAHLAAGRSYGSLRVKQRQRVLLILAEEDKLEIDLRLAAIRQQFDLPWQATAGWIRVMSLKEARLVSIGKTTGSSFEIDETSMDLLKAHIEEHDIDVVLADPLSKLHDASENDNVHVKIAMRRLTLLAQETQTAFMVAHHTPKITDIAGNMWAARGASALVGEVKILQTLAGMDQDMAKALDLDERERVKYARRDDAKANTYLLSAEPDWYERKTVNLHNGESVGVLVPHKFPNPAALVTPEMRMAFEEHVRWTVEQGETNPAAYIQVGLNWMKAGHALGEFLSQYGIEIGDRAAKRLLDAWAQSGQFGSEKRKFSKDCTRTVLTCRPETFDED